MKTAQVVPAIIPHSLAHLSGKIARLRGVVREVQIDIVDGILAPYTSWPYGEGDMAAEIARLRNALPEGLAFEYDLMIVHPPETLTLWLEQKPASVVLHLEGFMDDAGVAPALAQARARGARAILAAGNDTPVARLFPLIPQADGVQCMGIAAIGTQGNSFDQRVLARIKTLREAFPMLSISVDGSVNAQTILALKAAGANRFVVGSAIFDAPDPITAYARLGELVS